MNTIIETRTFSRKVSSLLTETGYENFLTHIANNPECGVLIQGTGGVRKVRWGKFGVGKRGGIRIIYFNNRAGETWLLTLYAKNERENIAPHELEIIRNAIND